MATQAQPQPPVYTYKGYGEVKIIETVGNLLVKIETADEQQFTVYRADLKTKRMKKVDTAITNNVPASSFVNTPALPLPDPTSFGTELKAETMMGHEKPLQTLIVDALMESSPKYILLDINANPVEWDKVDRKLHNATKGLVRFNPNLPGVTVSRNKWGHCFTVVLDKPVSENALALIEERQIRLGRNAHTSISGDRLRISCTDICLELLARYVTFGLPQ